jgi:hypothetical protein
MKKKDIFQGSRYSERYYSLNQLITTHTGKNFKKREKIDKKLSRTLKAILSNHNHFLVNYQSFNNQTFSVIHETNWLV